MYNALKWRTLWMLTFFLFFSACFDEKKNSRPSDIETMPGYIVKPESIQFSQSFGKFSLDAPPGTTQSSEGIPQSFKVTFWSVDESDVNQAFEETSDPSKITIKGQALSTMHSKEDGSFQAQVELKPGKLIIISTYSNSVKGEIYYQPVRSNEPTFAAEKTMQGMDLFEPVKPHTFYFLTSGSKHTCGINGYGNPYCWGNNNYGQLGNAQSIPSSSIPVPVDTSSIVGSKKFIQISAGGDWGRDFTCGLASDGIAYCWGANFCGQSGSPISMQNLMKPTPIDLSTITGSKKIIQIRAGTTSTSILTSDYKAYTFGGNSNCWSGNYQPQPLATGSVPLDSPIYDVVLGDNTTCFLTTSGKSYCSGDSKKMGAGYPEWPQFFQPSPVAMDLRPLGNESGFIKFADDGWKYNSGRMCASTPNHILYCWGSPNPYDASPRANNTSTLAKGEYFRKFSIRTDVICAVTNYANAYCWGTQVGAVPIPINTLGIQGAKTFKTIVTSGNGFYMLSTDDIAYQGEFHSGIPGSITPIDMSNVE